MTATAPQRSWCSTGWATRACRRYADYLPTDGFTVLNAISSIGAFVLGASAANGE